jgi:hypothetical protein
MRVGRIQWQSLLGSVDIGSNIDIGTEVGISGIINLRTDGAAPGPKNPGAAVYSV